jgi:hypothetical protein
MNSPIEYPAQVSMILVLVLVRDILRPRRSLPSRRTLREKRPGFARSLCSTS